MSAVTVIVGTLIYAFLLATFLIANKRHWDRERQAEGDE